ncbi:MAG: L,D-transpeptidase [Anaerolineae bacterium]
MNETDMVTSAPPRRRRTLKMGLWLLLVAVTLLGALAVNAGVSGPGAQEPGLLMALLGRATSLPPTPTKTPTVAPEFTATPTPPTPLPTDTPLPTATPTAAPVTTAAAAPGVTDELATLVRSYGYDPGGRFIVVDQDLQQMIVAERGAIRLFPVSTGDPEKHTRTPAWNGYVGAYWGTFSSFGVFADEGWFLFRSNGSILIHGAPYVRDNQGNKVYQQIESIGTYPASRGCIRLKPEDSAWFSTWQPEGVPAIILPFGGGGLQL